MTGPFDLDLPLLGWHEYFDLQVVSLLLPCKAPTHALLELGSDFEHDWTNFIICWHSCRVITNSTLSHDIIIFNYHCIHQCHTTGKKVPLASPVDSYLWVHTYTLYQMVLTTQHRAVHTCGLPLAVSPRIGQLAGCSRDFSKQSTCLSQPAQGVCIPTL